MKKILSLSLLMLSIATLTAAQTKKASLLYKLATTTAKNDGGFNKKNLFTETDTIASLNSKAIPVLSIFAGLKLNTSAALEIAESKPNSLQVQIPFKAYKNFTLSLAKQKLNNNNNFSFGTLKGNHIKTKVGGENGVHYRGYIEGDSTSIASISFFKDGSVMALFSNSTGNFIVGKMGNQKGDYIIYNDRNMRVPQNIQCATSDKEIMGKPLTNNFPLPSTGEAPPATLCKKVMLYWEGDYELYNYNFSANLTAAQNYMEGLFNQFAAMYQNEGIIVEAGEMNVWTTNDPYRNSPSINGLTDFKTYWNTAGNTFNGDMAHLIAGGRTNNGGIAYILGFFCSDKSYSYAYSNVWGFYNSVPTWSWDVEVVTHETGHNFGSQHTQWCGWNTGPGGTCGAIDNCYTLESGGGCSTCPSTTDTAHLPAGWQGTVMSYCHLSYIGINLANGFGPLPQNVIRNAVSGGACLNSLISVTATPQPICNTNDGAVILTYNSNNLGTSPYTYLWTPGNYTTKNITGLNTAGTYQVNITDHAGCSTSLSANVKALSKPGKLEKTNCCHACLL